MKKFLALINARNKEFYRDRGSLMWSLVFPFLVVLVFSYAFSGKPQAQYKIALHDPAGIASTLELTKLEHVEIVPVQELDPAIVKVERHQLDLLVSTQTGAQHRYWVNSTSPKGYFLEKILTPGKYLRQAVEGSETRYVDWVIPGILAMNMMFSALYGVGYTVVRYRKNGVLKRLKATPVTAFEFLTAQVFSRLLLIQLISIMVFLGCSLLVEFQMRGSYALLFGFFSLGSLCMISLSMVVAARIANEEFAEGMLNMLSWPMMFLSGVWFSLEGASPIVRKIAAILPLTHIVDGARAIMIDGAGIASISPQILVLSVLTVVFLALGSALFRWN